MNPIARKMYYIACIPLLFFINIMVTLSWWNTTPLWAVLALFFVFLRVAERYPSMERFNDSMKRLAVHLFPDVYQKGILPNGRFLMAVIPCLINMFMNILLSRI